jgi:hypothetical protein
MAQLIEDSHQFTFDGEIHAFTYIDKGIVHRRRIAKQKGKPVWQVTDEVINCPPSTIMRQLWHMPPDGAKHITFSAKNRAGAILKGVQGEGWQSGLYGKKDPTTELIFSETGNIIDTEITVHN